MHPSWSAFSFSPLIRDVGIEKCISTREGIKSQLNSKWNLASVLGSIGDDGALAPWGPIPSWTRPPPPITSICHCHDWTGHLLFSCWVLSNSFATPWTVADQAPLSMGFSSQEYWSGLPFPSLGDPPNPGIEPASALLHCSQFLYHWAPGNPWWDNNVDHHVEHNVDQFPNYFKGKQILDFHFEKLLIIKDCSPKHVCSLCSFFI